jgi:NitT/TauT family transport system permease protein
MIINKEYLLPDIPATFKALLEIVKDASFYRSVIFSCLRVIAGLSLGSAFGILLAILCNKFSILHTLFSPIITIIKSTPVASFIVLLWVLMSGDALTVFIGFLMVMPIIWQNLLDGYSAIDKNLIEVAEVYEFSYSKKLKLLIFPTLKKYLIPALITASGLAWKAGIAAEIIAYTKNSIGQGINDAKYNMETATVFAWTLVVIVLSIALEKTTKYFLRRVKDEC